MGKRIFRTLIKKEHKLGGNTYVEGRLSGIQYVVCCKNIELQYAQIGIEEGTVLLTMCTPKQYEKFSKIVEELYPGLCEFNYYRKESE